MEPAAPSGLCPASQGEPQLWASGLVRWRGALQTQRPGFGGCSGAGPPAGDIKDWQLRLPVLLRAAPSLIFGSSRQAQCLTCTPCTKHQSVPAAGSSGGIAGTWGAARAAAPSPSHGHQGELSLAVAVPPRPCPAPTPGWGWQTAQAAFTRRYLKPDRVGSEGINFPSGRAGCYFYISLDTQLKSGPGKWRGNGWGREITSWRCRRLRASWQNRAWGGGRGRGPLRRRHRVRPCSPGSCSELWVQNADGEREEKTHRGCVGAGSCSARGSQPGLGPPYPMAAAPPALPSGAQAAFWPQPLSTRCPGALRVRAGRRAARVLRDAGGAAGAVVLSPHHRQPGADPAPCRLRPSCPCQGSKQPGTCHLPTAEPSSVLN